MTNPTNRVVTTVVKMVLLAVVALVVPLQTAFGHDAIDVDADVFPWSSVGKIYNSARSSCTGSVIAPDKVLTAAHCLFNRATSPTGRITFSLGLQGGRIPLTCSCRELRPGPQLHAE